MTIWKLIKYFCFDKNIIHNTSSTNKNIILSLFLISLFIPIFIISALEFKNNSEGQDITLTLLGIAIILLLARISSLVEYWKQPAVLGELVMGIILGNLTLIGLNFFELLKNDKIIKFLAEFGVIILLFQIGLESNVERMKKVGLRSLMVAIIGVVAPFILGAYVVGPLFFPNSNTNFYIFLGAVLTATSIGITARVFQDLKKLHLPEAQIVLGAAVIDDILGLIILAIVSAIITVGTLNLTSIFLISIKALIFLIGSIILGQIFSPYIGKLLSKIHTGVGMKFTMALGFCLIFAFLAKKFGLAPLIGAFAAGLVLDPVHFYFFKDPEIVNDIKKEIEKFEENEKKKISSIIQKHSHRHIEDLIAPLGFFFIPIFFVITGMNVKIDVFFDAKVLLLALFLTLVAIIGKVVSGIAAGRVNKLLVGFGMVPRGEVGLIFASIGKELKVIQDQVFSVIVIMIVLTTLLTPPILALILRKNK